MSKSCVFSFTSSLPCLDCELGQGLYYLIYLILFFRSFSLPIWMLRIRVLTSHITEHLTVCDHLQGKTTSPSHGVSIFFVQVRLFLLSLLLIVLPKL